MASRGIQQFFYSPTLPSRAVAIAQVTAKEAVPSDLIDVVNIPYQAGTLGIWKASSGIASLPDFKAPDFNQSVAISGDVTYLVQNQFFEITNTYGGDGTPLYFVHKFGQPVAGLTILNLDGTPLSPAPTVLYSGNVMYHDVPRDTPCRVRYVDNVGRIQTSLLHYDPVLPYNRSGNVVAGYSLTGGVIGVASAVTSYSIRFLQPNGYRALAPYGAPSYLPWYPRVRFSPQLRAPEYSAQAFTPILPYMFGYWIPGRVLDSNLIEFDRKQIYIDPAHKPDIVVFDAAGKVKYALDGSANGQPEKHGLLYPWKRNQIADIDWQMARVSVVGQLDPSDKVYAFYSYREQDFVYTAIDVNPVTNPAVRNRIVVFYFRSSSSPLHRIYHQVFDDAGPVAGLTNDPTPPTWSDGPIPSSGTVFALMVVGVSFGASTFEVVDARARGGGLAPAYQNIPEADNFWDLGYVDGRPYPVGGALMVYLPVGILETMSRDMVQQKVNATLPMGTLAVIRYYDPEGNESV